MTDIRERLQADLEGSYAIERELGRGGVATVFLARESPSSAPSGHQSAPRGARGWLKGYPRFDPL